MVVLEVYTKCIKVKYKAFLLSKATLVALLSGLVSVILPFVLCSETGGFWQKRDVVYVQPDVKFTGDFLFLATSSENPQVISCSSFAYYKKYMKNFDTCSTIKVRELDDNHDGKADSLHFTITAGLPKHFKMSSIHLVLPINYTLGLPCTFHTQSAIIYQNFVTSSLTQISVYADLGLKQSEAIRCSKYDLAMNPDYLLIDKENIQSAKFENIIARYAESKLKTTLDNVLTTTNPTQDSTFTFNLILKYPEHKIYFKPRFWQIVKLAWMQYIAVYIIISWIILQIKTYIFKNNLVLMYEDKTNINKKYNLQ
ncbi:unnamed protein product [Ceutorhynchus assimilis]|uniref:Transmembrane protein 231 n=1 Tax=Ceutorhynchus assimilis TaxID=467358 RepID=A0A9N9MVC1_9CUCU|nr:unnamed protein product [Ceutorhynchus assimilis]